MPANHLFPGLICTAYTRSDGHSASTKAALRLPPPPVTFPSPASPSPRRQRWAVRQRTVSAHRRRRLLQDVATFGSPTSAATAPTPPSRPLSKKLMLNFLSRLPNPRTLTLPVPAPQVLRKPPPRVRLRSRPSRSLPRRPLPVSLSQHPLAIRISGWLQHHR
jgi:hypothetical protein